MISSYAFGPFRLVHHYRFLVTATPTKRGLSVSQPVLTCQPDETGTTANTSPIDKNPNNPCAAGQFQTTLTPADPGTWFPSIVCLLLCSFIEEGTGSDNTYAKEDR
ncbi:hypothetical protein [Amycolatopsis cihanbeyliensis]|uniref:hypothetical protein n=1 Tax=Amycolatopsis cihanbeyliensis TaxID=1128664 RepID=UPI001151C7B7|nr:hypothetical protein [Amycolatopsis cihanbeyliensis]